MPLALYFIDHPAQFFGRTSEISIFAGEKPIEALTLNAIKTIGMFWVYGDPNWRHNFSGAPELNIAVGIFFLLGIMLAIKNLFPQKHLEKIDRFNGFFLLFWLALMLAPVVLSSEGLPHALRAIITIPPVMILSAYGLNAAFEKFISWLHRKRKEYPERENQLLRIRREVVLLIVVLFIALAADAYDKYFNKWANNENVYTAFNAKDWDMVKYLNTLPDDLEKFIVVRDKILDSRVISISSQSVLFGTGTFLPEARSKKNYRYVSPKQLEEEIAKNPYRWGEILFLGSEDRELVSFLTNKYKNIKIKIPTTEFITLTLTP